MILSLGAAYVLTASGKGPKKRKSSEGKAEPSKRRIRKFSEEACGEALRSQTEAPDLNAGNFLLKVETLLEVAIKKE